jgi:hypothetical protein
MGIMVEGVLGVGFFLLTNAGNPRDDKVSIDI